MIRKILKIIGLSFDNLLIKVASILIFLFKGKTTKELNPPSILFFGYMGIGNYLLFTPTIRLLRNHFRNSTFTIMYDPDSEIKYLAKNSGLFDNYLEIKIHTNRFQLFKNITKIRKAKIHTVLFHFLNYQTPIILATLLGGFKYRVGHVSNKYYTKLHKIFNKKILIKDNKHEIDINLDFSAYCNITLENVNKKPILKTSKDAQKKINEILKQIDISENDKIIAIQIGASQYQQWKRWNIKKFKNLIKKLHENKNFKTIILGSKEEFEDIDKLIENIDPKPLNIAGETTIEEASIVIERSDVCIANDSGLMHVSGAVGTPVIAIYGPTDYIRTAPYGSNNDIIRINLDCSPCYKMSYDKTSVNSCNKNYLCLNSISVTMVYNAVINKLNEID